MSSKPCERIGCPNAVRSAGMTPKVFTRRRFCSLRCSALHRIAQGFRPPITQAQRVEAGRKGGLRCGVVRHRRAAKEAAEALAPFFSDDVLGSLPYAQQLKLKALLARAWRSGHTAGKSATRMARHDAQKRQKEAA